MIGKPAIALRERKGVDRQKVLHGRRAVGAASVPGHPRTAMNVAVARQAVVVAHGVKAVQEDRRAPAGAREGRTGKAVMNAVANKPVAAAVRGAKAAQEVRRAKAGAKEDHTGKAVMIAVENQPVAAAAHNAKAAHEARRAQAGAREQLPGKAKTTAAQPPVPPDPNAFQRKAKGLGAPPSRGAMDPLTNTTGAKADPVREGRSGKAIALNHTWPPTLIMMDWYG
ncbi:MAG: hypothetical protein WAT41_07475 [Flavobacteriales bacterium]